jgi:hypothetical protein
MVYLRRFTLPESSILSGYDPNVAHAGIKVKITAIKVEANIKDIPALLPQGKQSHSPVVASKGTPAADQGLLRIPKWEIKTNSDLYRAGTFAVAAGGGILMGILARPPMEQPDLKSEKSPSPPSNPEATS